MRGISLLVSLILLFAASHARADAAPARGNPPARGALAGDGDSPTGFWYATDSWPTTTKAGPQGWFTAPETGGAYGGYVGMVGDWALWWGCANSGIRQLAWSSADAEAANVNLDKFGKGIGTSAYWFMAGPGVDPHYNGTASEAFVWGEGQAAETLLDMAGKAITSPVVWMDIEIPGIPPAPDNGWKDVYAGVCSSRVVKTGIAASLDRAVFNGYFDYLKARGKTLYPGVYSDPDVWQYIFGTGGAASIPHTDEWTYSVETTNFNNAPRGWCLQHEVDHCAQWFGGVTSSNPNALMWQWSGGGGISNGVGDFDQVFTDGNPV